MNLQQATIKCMVLQAQIEHSKACIAMSQVSIQTGLYKKRDVRIGGYMGVPATDEQKLEMEYETMEQHRQRILELADAIAQVGTELAQAM